MVEPVEGLRAGHDVRVLVGQRDDLGGAQDRVRAGSRCGQELEHLRQRLDRRHAVAERDERARQLPRSGAEVDDVARLVSREPAHRLDRVVGPAALVRIGHVRERRVRPARARIAIHDHETRAYRPGVRIDRGRASQD